MTVLITECTALILAGGDSQRMGQDKASVLLGERSLLQCVRDVVQPMFAQTLLSLRSPQPDIDLPQVCDAYANAGPLAGLCAGLETANTAWVFAVATDMPFVQTDLIIALAARRAGFQAVVPMVHGHPQPLAAFYATSALPIIKALLAGEGKKSLRALLEQLQVSYVDEADLRVSDPSLKSFFDLDTPEDVVKARDFKIQ